METMFEIADNDDKKARNLLKLLDLDNDEKLEFPELMLYIFGTEENLSGEQKILPHCDGLSCCACTTSATY